MRGSNYGKLPMPTEAEIEQALACFYGVVESSEHTVELRKALPRLRGRTTRAARVRGRLGTRLCLEYRKETGETGAIDWSKFRQWLDEHMGEINFARLLVSILMLMLVFL